MYFSRARSSCPSFIKRMISSSDMKVPSTCIKSLDAVYVDLDSRNVFNCLRRALILSELTSTRFFYSTKHASMYISPSIVEYYSGAFGFSVIYSRYFYLILWCVLVVEKPDRVLPDSDCQTSSKNLRTSSIDMFMLPRPVMELSCSYCDPLSIKSLRPMSGSFLNTCFPYVLICSFKPSFLRIATILSADSFPLRSSQMCKASW